MPRRGRRYWTAHGREGGAMIAAEAQVRWVRRRLAGERRRLLVGPEQPDLPHVMWKVAKRLGLRVVGPGEQPAALRLHWATPAVAPPAPFPYAINGACLDISKSRVERAMQAVLGYGLEVDGGWKGPCVRKSEENGAHDGALAGARGAPRPGTVLQRLVDTQRTPGVLEELRVPIVAGCIPFVYVKRRDARDLFGRGASSIRLATPEDELAPAEVAGVTAVAGEIRLELGEVDVLRDRHDGRIYVVDVNRTPFGPPRALGAGRASEAVRRLAEAVAAAYF